MLIKFQPDFWRYVKEIEAQAKKRFPYKKKCTSILAKCLLMHFVC